MEYSYTEVPVLIYNQNLYRIFDFNIDDIDEGHGHQLDSSGAPHTSIDGNCSSNDELYTDIYNPITSSYPSSQVVAAASPASSQHLMYYQYQRCINLLVGLHRFALGPSSYPQAYILYPQAQQPFRTSSIHQLTPPQQIVNMGFSSIPTQDQIAPHLQPEIQQTQTLQQTHDGQEIMF